jgi:hypothetical protein
MSAHQREYFGGHHVDFPSAVDLFHRDTDGLERRTHAGCLFRVPLCAGVQQPWLVVPRLCPAGHELPPWCAHAGVARDLAYGGS